MANHALIISNQSIVIIGAGYSGTLTAVNILREHSNKCLQIVLIDNQAPLGRGLAYRCWDDNLLLNVPAGNMSALANEPEHFVAYCKAIDPAFNGGSFVSRRIYGDYLEQTLTQAEKDSNCNLQKISGEAVAVRKVPDSNTFVVNITDGKVIEANKVILAFGHFPPKNPQPDSTLFTSDAYISNPWNFTALDRITHHHPVLILGTGHTAIDALFRLTSSNDKRKVILLSRRGLLPQGHRFTSKPPMTGNFPAYLEKTSNTVLAHMQAIRKEVKVREAAGGNWRDVINELRPHTPDIWHKLPLTERRKFLTRVAAFWDIHRHRLAPSADQRLKKMLDSGQVKIVTGKVLRYEKQTDSVLVTIRQKQNNAKIALSVEAVVNCTGPNYDITTLTQPLLVQLQNEGYLKQDPLKIGLELDDQYQVINQDGQSVQQLFYVGPMLKAKYWEAIAVPELRIHTYQLARRLLDKA
ncbi:MAG: FAD/NAD(P)-binding protein [Pseudomonadota bacterium]